jgi:hypothetical protein
MTLATSNKWLHCFISVHMSISYVLHDKNLDVFNCLGRSIHSFIIRYSFIVRYSLFIINSSFIIHHSSFIYSFSHQTNAVFLFVVIDPNSVHALILIWNFLFDIHCNHDDDDTNNNNNNNSNNNKANINTNLMLVFVINDKQILSLRTFHSQSCLVDRGKLS